MESKNIKVTDEHGIDRVANVVTKITVDGADYVIYWIERDNENDNLFVSKLVMNNDGTSNMVNIDDQMEKNKLTDIVKELVTKAVGDEGNHAPGSTVNLESGKNVTFSSVLFNKEQNISVHNTYVTTIKKSVTKVSEDYYGSAKETAPVMAEPVVENVEMPSLEETTDVVQPVEEVVPPVIETPIVAPVINEVTVPQEVPVEAPVVNVQPEVGTPTAPEVNLNVPPVVEPVAAPVQPEVIQQVVTPVAEPVVVPAVEPAPVVTTPAVENVIPPVQPVTVEPVNTPTAEPVTVPPQPGVVPPIVEPTVASVQPEGVMFDGSKETNLQQVFNAAPMETPIAVNNVDDIREFGQETPIVNQAPNGPSSGFANQKILMVVVIAFFVAACVFLGYEVFNYLQIK